MDATNTSSSLIPTSLQDYTQVLYFILRDIRPKNIFLTSGGNIKLGSFKASKIL